MEIDEELILLVFIPVHSSHCLYGADGIQFGYCQSEVR